MEEMSLELQIECMQQMRDFLEEFCGMMVGDIESLEKDLADLRSQGFSVEKADDYRDKYLDPAAEVVERLVEEIQKYHFEYLDGIIQTLEEILNLE